MSNKVKYVDMKNPTYYFFNNMINTKNFNLNNIKLGETSCKNILICYIGYVSIKGLKYRNIYSVNPLSVIFNKVNRYFEEINGNEY